VVGQPRSTQRRRPLVRDDEEALTAAIIRLATTYGRYGYRRVRALLCAEGWRVNLKRVYRIWRREGLKVPQKQPKRGPSLAERRIVRSSSAGASRTCLVL
jgi:transposase InsO family protein